MKKSNLLLSLFSAFVMAVVFFFPSQHAQAQCTPYSNSIAGYDLDYEVINESAATKVRFYLDYEAASGDGVYGFQLQVTMVGGIVGVTDLQYALAGSWLFASTSATVSASYDPSTRVVSFVAQRLDCKGAEGTGFIGEVIIYRDSCPDIAVERLGGLIVMVDNVDAG